MKPIHVGIGGWTFAPWRGPFYPPGLIQAKELAYAGSRLTAIEINGTFYRTQAPASFVKWRNEVPDGFVFSVKAPRAATHRTALLESQPSVARFLDSGLVELGDRLGPILWQFPPTRRFEPEHFADFLSLLPAAHNGDGAAPRDRGPAPELRLPRMVRPAAAARRGGGRSSTPTSTRCWAT